MKIYLAYAVAMILAALAVTPVAAAPVAPLPPLSKVGKEVMAAQQGGEKKTCPTAAYVAMPVYPASYCLSNVITSSNGKEFPIQVLKLVSKDSPAKVRAWYGKRLGGWKYDPELKNYAPSNWAIQKVMFVPQVEIKQADDTNLAIFKTVFELNGMHTLINVYYLPHREGAQ